MSPRRLITPLLLCLILPLFSVAGSSAHVRRHRTRHHHAHRRHAHHRRHHHRRHHHRRHHHPPAHHQTPPPEPTASSSAVLPDMGAQPAPSLFGLNTGTFDSNHSYFLQDLPTARQLGARWVHFTGDSLHWIDGQLNYGVLDWEVKQARQEGLGVLFSLGGALGACSLQPLPASPTNCPPTTASDLQAYQAFLRGLLLHYRHNITYYESWVEPNHPSHWLPAPNPAQYARLLEAQYQVFQSVNQQYGLHLKLLFGSPADFSIIPGSSGGIAVLPFTHQVLDDLLGQRVFDGIALHPYRFPPTHGPETEAWDSVQGIPSAPGANGPYPAQGCVGITATIDWCQMTWPQELSAYEQEFLNHGYGQEPLWLSEFGWPGNATAGDSYHPDYALQAQDLEQAYQDLLSLPFVQAAFWFNVRDYQPGLANPDPEFFAHYGLLEYDRTPKPAAGEFTALAQANPDR